MRKFLFILYLFFLLHAQAFSQELNARVELNAPQIQNVNKRVVDLLQKVIQDFLNNQSWTNVTITPQERIDCNFIITIYEYDGSKEFKADAQVMSSRPVYGTNYNSPILVFRDKTFNFSYVEGEQLDFSDTQNLNNLTALLGFYANVIVGMDMDTFKLNGGTAAFSNARNIVNYSQSATQVGWKAMESMDNRYWLITNLLDRKFNAYREFAYQYHINGLDQMASNDLQARQNMSKLIPKLKEVDRFGAGNILTPAFYAAKANEFVGVFSRLPGNESVVLYNLLAELDPSNISKYEALKRS
ncbi:DUF4835 family protein [Sphingobacterium hungaricum]|uniref:type IX secretion system protein PorD n=1 Tax=Sphingobacterium hungaricum TaxID=2082723 RepID=UPI001E363AE7|nr:DUF4835 family protein [Sphingobacterium hungaricum]